MILPIKGHFEYVVILKQFTLIIMMVSTDSVTRYGFKLQHNRYLINLYQTIQIIQKGDFWCKNR
jgi:hypothetical protein